MAKKPLRITRHASERMLGLSLTLLDLEKIQEQGRIMREGRTKRRIVGRIKKGVVVLICEEYPDHVVVKTVVKGR
jgi:UDP-N-acetylglucosamine 2-epimerase